MNSDLLIPAFTSSSQSAQSTKIGSVTIKEAGLFAPAPVCLWHYACVLLAACAISGDEQDASGSNHDAGRESRHRVPREFIVFCHLRKHVQEEPLFCIRSLANPGDSCYTVYKQYGFNGTKIWDVI